MRILICDDDKPIIEQIRELLREFFDAQNQPLPEIVCYRSGEALLGDTGDMDILFLDIEMPGISGIRAGSELKKRNSRILIFIVTSYPEYLDDAMRFHVFRYLTKPLDKQRFMRNMRDAMEVYYAGNVFLPVETRETTFTVSTVSIVAVEAQGHDVIVHTLDQDYLSVQPMQFWLEFLPGNCFFQTHRSFLVNLEHVTDFDHTLIHVTGNRCRVYLARRKYRAFRDAYFLYLEARQ